MLDRLVQNMLAPVLQTVGRALLRAGWGADALTGLGFGVGMAGAVAIANQAFGLGLFLLLASRLLDGLDGAVARLTRPTDAGGFLDIALDFLFYAAVPLAFAVLAEKRQLSDTALPGKSFYFLVGLTEATETIAVFAAMCWWPQHFAILAYGFSVLCAITTAMRVVWGYQKLKSLP